VGIRILVSAAGLVIAFGACSSPGVATKVTCQFTLGTESATGVLLDSRSTVRTPLGVDHLTGQVSRRGGDIRLSVFGPSPKDRFTMGSDGGATKFSAAVSEGQLRGTCRE
jgi:hypothetical protein